MTVLTSASTNITGTASGSGSCLAHMAGSDFRNGTMNDTRLDSGGNVTLGGGLYDDFNEQPQPAGINTSRWTETNTNGSNSMVANSRLSMYAASQVLRYWSCHGELISTAPVGNFVAGTLAEMHAGPGEDYNTSIGAHQDDENWIRIGRCLDGRRFGSMAQVYIEMCINGTYNNSAFGDASAFPSRYSIRLNGTSASLYEGERLFLTQDIVLQNPRCIFRTSNKYQNQGVRAFWDDASFELCRSGHFTSAQMDTRSTAPVLSRIDWDASIPFGTGLSVRLRSSENVNMSPSTDWVDVEDGQVAGLPAARRYLQYAVSMVTTDLEDAPVFRSVNISFTKPLVKVEISIDAQRTWLLANGTDNWRIETLLPEGRTAIWVRATDVAGDTDLRSRDIDVDLTRPAGSMAIEGGNRFTASRDVMLSFTASDDYGIGRVMLSESPLFYRAEWLDFNETMPFTLSSGEGKKTIYAKLRDRSGWESAPFNATITYDELPPAGQLTIDDGGGYTRKTSVQLAINATDVSGITEMKLGNSANFEGAAWMVFQPRLAWELTSQEGPHTVFLALKDEVGHVSGTITAQVVLDTVSPSLTLRLNEEAKYTNSQKVRAEIVASDKYCITAMQLSESPAFAGASWAPFRPSADWNLSAGDGAKKVFARVRDAAGNHDNAASADIVLDTVPPSSSVSALPPVSITTIFAVKWSGDDATSGVRSYDVQYQDSDGSWVDWQTQTKSTQANFNGAHGHVYGFRAKAVDLAGNQEDYPEGPDSVCAVELPELMKPIVAIGGPRANDTVGGRVTVVGSSSHPVAGRSVTLVEVQIDDGPWKPAGGTASWSMALDTGKLANGRHFVRARAFDGGNYSTVEELQFYVKNESGGFIESNAVYVIVAAAVAVGAVAAVVAARRKSKGQKSNIVVVSARAAEAAPGPPQSAYPPIQGGPADVDRAGQAPPAAAQPAVSAEERAAAARRRRILSALSSLPRGLPPEFSGMEMDELADLVASGERMAAGEGRELVNVNGRWYNGNEDDPMRFMQEYRKQR